PIVEHGRDRDDEPPGGQARARSGDLLRHVSAGDRLRLLAPGSRLGHGRSDHREPDAECRHRAEDDRRSGRSHRRRTNMRLQGRARHGHHHPDEGRARTDQKGSRAHHRTLPQIMNIVVTGSIAFDYLMSFPGKFTEHFLPEHMNRVSLSFLVDTMDMRRGGCAPNIAYTLALLGERPLLMATAGEDFGEYRQWLEAAGIDTSLVRLVAGKFCASFFCSTDQANNQIASFYTGAMANAGELSFRTVRDCGFAIISPNDPGAMVQYAEECRTLNIPFIFDPGQQCARMSGDEL